MNNYAYIFIYIGIAFNFFGCLGLVRLPDVYNRLQAATKCVTLGTAFIMLGTAVHFGFTGQSVKALVCLVFILFTSPTAAHAIARGAYHSGVKLWEKSVIDQYAKDKEKLHGEKS